MGEDNRTVDTRFMDLAFQLALEAKKSGEIPVGAVVVANGDVIGRGFNAPIGSNDPTAHAEIRALREAGAAQGNYRLTGSTLYVTLEPCLMCAGAMIHARIDRLVFACADARTGAAGSLYRVVQDTRLNHRITVSSGVGEERSRHLLRAFFERRRSKSYA
jgi:tRNA(adenine34) deaminase